MEQVLNTEMKPVAWHYIKADGKSGLTYSDQGEKQGLYTADQLKQAKVEVLREAASKTFCNYDRYILYGTATEIEKGTS